MRAKCIFVGGTASHVGKSWMATAIGRYLRGTGMRVAPFKAQNMSNNSHPLPGGGEIGRAQAVQAAACGVEPTCDMNPILLKPNSDRGSQVVLNGRVWKNLSASEYYQHFDELLDHVMGAYQRLSQQYEYIVIEGAGSVAEMNLKSHDLVNFGLAVRVGAPALLVADIDRGGVFASIIGTMGLLEKGERALVRSFAVNRFRGDPNLFEPGVKILQEKSNRPCLGVFPALMDTEIDSEDGVSLPAEAMVEGPRDIAIVALPRLSNSTDFQRLAHIRRVSKPDDGTYRCILIPGTKNTIGDLQWMRERGLDEWVLRQHKAGARIIGICGGYQMLGESIQDGVRVDGLGLLPVTSVMEALKTTREVRAVSTGGTEFTAYEIHMGITVRPAGCAPFARTEFGDEGICENNCIGTYLHGALENEEVIRELLGIGVASRQPKEDAYDALGSWFESNADLRLFEEAYL